MNVPWVAGSPLAQRALPSGMPTPQMAMLVGTSLARTPRSSHSDVVPPAGTRVVVLGSSHSGADAIAGAEGGSTLIRIFGAVWIMGFGEYAAASPGSVQ